MNREPASTMYAKYFLGFFFAIVAMPLGAFDGKDDTCQVCEEHCSAVEGVQHNLKKGFKGYVPLDLVLPGQIRHMGKTTFENIRKLFPSEPNFDSKKSSIGENKYFPVILGPNGLVILIDGHHSYLGVQVAKDQSFPINVEDDLSELAWNDFLQEALQKNYIYPYDLQGRLIRPNPGTWFRWGGLIDDPNRFLLSLERWKCSEGTEIGKRSPLAAQDPEFPLWIKGEDNELDTAFLEFKMATLLYEAGLNFDYTGSLDQDNKWKYNPNTAKAKAFAEKARKVLSAAIENGKLKGLKLLTEGTSSKDFKCW